MTEENILGLKWLTYILESYPIYIIFPLTLLIILSILYYPALVFIIITYSSSTFYFLCKKIGNLPEDTNSKQWDKPKQVVMFLIDIIGKFLHGYEVCGMENLPEGPALLIFYHGVPVDYCLLVMRIYRLTGRLCYSVTDHAVFIIPGLKVFLDVHRFDHPSREKCVEILKKGNLLGIGPGGLREQNYGIMRWLYETTRMFFFPGYGLLPVKLRTYIGQQIPYDPNITAEELVEKTKAAVEGLRDKHQKIPGNIWRAIKERFD